MANDKEQHVRTASKFLQTCYSGNMKVIADIICAEADYLGGKHESVERLIFYLEDVRGFGGKLIKELKECREC